METADAQRLRAARELAPEVAWDDLAPAAGGRLLADRATGNLFERMPGDPLVSPYANPRQFGEVALFTVEPSGAVVLLRRPSASRPQSLEELDRLAAEQRRTVLQQQAEQAAEREARRANPPARTLTVGDAERNLGTATLRELAHRLEAAGGVLVVEQGGGVTIRAERPNESALVIGRVLSGAAETIRSCVKRPGPVDPEALPDVQLTLAGELLPAKLEGREDR